jgi:hypothetical protein
LLQSGFHVYLRDALGICLTTYEQSACQRINILIYKQIILVLLKTAVTATVITAWKADTCPDSQHMWACVPVLRWRDASIQATLAAADRTPF